MMKLSPILALIPCLSALQAVDAPVDGTALPRQQQRVRLLRFQPGFLADPVNVFPDDPLAPEFPEPLDDSGDWINVWVGNDNPFTDFRPAGTPGGVGYTRIVGQVQMLEQNRTGLALNLEAVTPAGRQADGVEVGPTVFTPAVAVYHELMSGVALHGFVGTQVGLDSTSTSSTRGQVEYGVALQHPLFTPRQEEEGGLYVSFGALGRWSDPREGTPLRQGLEMQPGLHWQLDSRTWLSGAVIVPIQRTSRQEQPFWQITCQFQF